MSIVYISPEISPFVNAFYIGNPITGTLANSDDSDEMQHNAEFHQGLHCLLRFKQPSGTEIHHNLEKNLSVTP